MRVNDLAKELGKPNKEIIEILQKNQIDVKSHMSSVSDDQAALVRKSYASGAKSAPVGAQKNVSAAEAKPAAPAKAKEAAKPEEKPAAPSQEPRRRRRCRPERRAAEKENWRRVPSAE